MSLPAQNFLYRDNPIETMKRNVEQFFRGGRPQSNVPPPLFERRQLVGHPNNGAKHGGTNVGDGASSGSPSLIGQNQINGDLPLSFNQAQQAINNITMVRPREFEDLNQDTIKDTALEFEHQQFMENQEKSNEGIGHHDENQKGIGTTIGELFPNSVLSSYKWLKFNGEEAEIYSDQNLSTIVEKYEVSKRLGKGSGGSVFLCTKQSDKTSIALKKIHVEDKYLLEIAVKEYSLLVKMNEDGKGTDNRITPVFELFIDIDSKNETYIMYFTMPVYKTDLEKYMKQARKDSTINQNIVLSVMTQVSKALSYIHKNNICHRDIKPANILVEDIKPDSISCVLADFGLSKEIEGSSRHSNVGTLSFMAPEILTEESYGLRVDVFGLGIVLYQLITGDYTKKIAWELVQKPENLVEQLIQQQMKTAMPSLEEDLIQIIVSMLKKSPRQRIHATEIYHYCLMQKTKSKKLQLVEQRQTHQIPKPIPPLRTSTLPPHVFHRPPSKTLINTATSHAATEIHLPEEVASATVTPTTTNFDSLIIKTRSKSFSQRQDITLHVVTETLASSFKRLFTKSEENSFSSLESAVSFCRSQPQEITFTIYLHPGVHKIKQVFHIDRGNIIFEGIEKNEEEAIVQGEKIIITSNVHFRKLNFVGKKLIKGSLMTNPITIQCLNCEPKIFNCRIKGKISIHSKIPNLCPHIEGTEIFGNSDKIKLDPHERVGKEALYIENCLPIITKNRIHDNESSGVGLKNCGGIFSNNHIYNNYISEVPAVILSNGCTTRLVANNFYDNLACLSISGSELSCENNEFRSSRIGINVINSSVILDNNEIVAIVDWAITLKRCSNFKITNNKLHNNRIGLFMDEIDGEGQVCGNRFSSSNSKQFSSVSISHLSKITNVVLLENIFFQNVGGGINISGKDDLSENYAIKVTISKNQIFNNSMYGIRVFDARGIFILDNNIFSNNDHGILLDSEHATTVEYNNIKDHLHSPAISILKNSNHLIVNNVLSGNSKMDLFIKEPISRECNMTIKENKLSSDVTKSIQYEGEEGMFTENEFKE